MPIFALLPAKITYIRFQWQINFLRFPWRPPLWDRRRWCYIYTFVLHRNTLHPFHVLRIGFDECQAWSLSHCFGCKFSGAAQWIVTFYLSKLWWFVHSKWITITKFILCIDLNKKATATAIQLDCMQQLWIRNLATPLSGGVHAITASAIFWKWAEIMDLLFQLFASIRF